MGRILVHREHLKLTLWCDNDLYIYPFLVWSSGCPANGFHNSCQHGHETFSDGMLR